MGNYKHPCWSLLLASCQALGGTCGVVMRESWQGMSICMASDCWCHLCGRYDLMLFVLAFHGQVIMILVTYSWIVPLKLTCKTFAIIFCSTIEISYRSYIWQMEHSFMDIYQHVRCLSWNYKGLKGLGLKDVFIVGFNI